MSLSPNDVARRAGLSRAFVMIEIRAGHLKAAKNNLGHWRIAEEDFEAWMSQRPAKGDTVTNTVTVSVSDTVTELKVAVGRLEAELAGARELIGRQDEEIRFMRQALEREQAKRWWNLFRKG